MFELHDIDRPYPGLRPFEAWEKEIFFGRLAHTERLLEILAAQHFLAVIGPSGSGKSSLVRAGLLPELPRGRLGTGTRWRIATLRPGNAPIQHLARALLQRSALGEALLPDARIPATPDAQTTEVALLEAELRLGPLGLVDVAQRAARCLEQSDRALEVKRPSLNLLVLVDQFEELFTYLDAGGTDAEVQKGLAEEADAFVNLLLKARAVPEARVCVVLTMRTDFLGACVRFLDLPDAINRAQYLTPRLQRSEIELAITGPAHHFGGSIDAALVQELINAVGADADQLPILQHALGRAWDFAVKRAQGGPVEIIAKDFADAGGVQQALSQHADLVLAGLSGRAVVPDVLTPEQVLARELFCAITEQRSADSGGQTVRRPQSLRRIAERAGRQPDDYLPVLRAFADARVNFLTFQGDPGPATVIDISHEALIRQWDRLRGWVAAEARRSGEYRRLRRQAAAYFDKEVGSSVLSGVALTRALEWLAAGGASSVDGWGPTVEWAVRYARQATLSDARAELAQIRAYVQSSEQALADAVRRAADELARKSQAEKDEIERRAAQVLLAEQRLRIQAEESRTTEAELRSAEATAAASRQKLLNWLLGAALALALVAVGYSIRLYGQSDQRRQVIEGQALWLPLTIETGRLGPKDVEALLRVARADEERLAAFALQLRDEETLAERFLREPGAVLAAWVGPSPAARRGALALFGTAPAPAAGLGGVLRLATPAALPAEPDSARALARAVVVLALDNDPSADARLAAALALAARGYRGDDRDGWRMLGNALLNLAPDLAKSRRIAVYQALKEAAQNRGAPPARPLSLVVAMAALRDDLPDSEMPELFDQLLGASLDITDADIRRDAQRAADAAPGGIGDSARNPGLMLPPGAARKGVLRSQLIRVAARLPAADARQRWHRVWAEIELRQKTVDGVEAAPAKAGKDDKAAPPGLAEAPDPPASAAAPTRATPGVEAEAPARRGGLDRSELAGLLAALAPRLTTEMQALAVEQLIGVLARGIVPHAAGHRRPGAAVVLAELRPYSDTLVSLIPKLTPAQRLLAANRLLALYGQRGLTDPQRDRLWQALQTAAFRLVAPEVDEFARNLARLAWRKDGMTTGEADQSNGATLWQLIQPRLSAATAGLMPRWAAPGRDDDTVAPADKAAELPAMAATSPLPDVKPALAALLKRIDAADDAEVWRPLGRQLESLTLRSPPAQLLDVIDTLLAAIVESTDSDQSEALVRGLRGTITLLPPAQAGTLRRRLAQELGIDGNPGVGRPATALWPIYLQLVATAPADEQRRLAREMLVQIDSGRATSGRSRELLDQTARQLAAADVPALAGELINSIANLPESGAASQDLPNATRPSLVNRRLFGQPGYRVQALEPVAAGLLQRLPPDQRPALQARLIDSLLASQSALGSAALGRLIKSATSDSAIDRERMVGLALAALPRTSRAQDVDALLTAARELLAQQAPGQEVARDLFEVMKYPGQIRKTVVVVRQVFKDAPAPDTGWWALVDWARKAWPRLPLDQRAPERLSAGLNSAQR